MKLAQEYSDEDKARELLERWRWPNGPVCPHCKNDGKQKANCKLEAQPDSREGVRDGVYFCGACREQFTVTVGTIFEGSHLPLSKWLMAIFLMATAKKSVSAHQLHRMLGITYKTAWFLAHRIRYAMRPGLPLGDLLTGTVEVDETYIGGRGPMRTVKSRKTPVVALVERDGRCHTRIVADVTQKNLKMAINATVSKEAIVNTDESGVYRRQLKAFKRHDVVNHSKEEYARTNPDGTVSHVNSCESFFSLLKRGVVGSWHHVSREHLPKYADEFAFRWTHRKMTDGERMQRAVQAAAGKRLTYKPLTSLKAQKSQAERRPEVQQPRRIFREPARF